MEIHNECQFSNTLFQPVENCPKASLLTFKPYLQDVFAAEENANEGLLLQLNQELLVIHSENRQFSGYVQIHFDLKFEVIYEEEVLIGSCSESLSPPREDSSSSLMPPDGSFSMPNLRYKLPLGQRLLVNCSTKLDFIRIFAR